MPLSWRRGGLESTSRTTSAFAFNTGWLILLFALCLSLADAMTPARIAELRRETVDMFYHGFDNYMNVAFPEDEVRI